MPNFMSKYRKHMLVFLLVLRLGKRIRSLFMKDPQLPNLEKKIDKKYKINLDLSIDLYLTRFFSLRNNIKI